ncbi:MAG: HAD-IA family hydrolase [Candidatus Marinimicrobia bacterium]|nr:HAD-IA family hydrolase [Candidatus Neomarinimicrobiota bacterium]
MTRSVPAVKNIVFDLGNIIMDVDYRRFTDTMRWDYEAFMRFFGSPFFREFETGKRSENEFFKELNACIPLAPGDEKRYQDNIHKAFSMRTRTWAMIHWLKKRHPVFLFSNTNSLDFDAICKQTDLNRVIRFFYVSYVEGFIKPDPRAYARFEQMFNIDPAETLFVDDREENVLAARQSGWKAETIGDEDRLFEMFKHYTL